MNPWINAAAAVVVDVINWVALFGSFFIVGASIYIYIDNNKKRKG